MLSVSYELSESDSHMILNESRTLCYIHTWYTVYSMRWYSMSHELCLTYTHGTQWVTNSVLHPHMILCILNETILNESRTLSYIHTWYSMSHELCFTYTHGTQWVTNSVLHPHMIHCVLNAMILNASRTLSYIHTWYSMFDAYWHDTQHIGRVRDALTIICDSRRFALCWVSYVTNVTHSWLNTLAVFVTHKLWFMIHQWYFPRRFSLCWVSYVTNVTHSWLNKYPHMILDESMGIHTSMGGVQRASNWRWKLNTQKSCIPYLQMSVGLIGNLWR